MNGVGVLKLVHQHLATALVVFAHRGVVAQQLEGAQQQLGKIHQAGRLQLSSYSR